MWRDTISPTFSEAGGWHLPFPIAGGGLTKGATVVAAAPGAVDDLRRLASV